LAVGVFRSPLTPTEDAHIAEDISLERGAKNQKKRDGYSTGRDRKGEGLG